MEWPFLLRWQYINALIRSINVEQQGGFELNLYVYILLIIWLFLLHFLSALKLLINLDWWIWASFVSQAFAMGKKSKIGGQITQKEQFVQGGKLHSSCQSITTRNKGTSAVQTPFSRRSLGLNNCEKQNDFKVVSKKYSLKRKKEKRKSFLARNVYGVSSTQHMHVWIS